MNNIINEIEDSLLTLESITGYDCIDIDKLLRMLKYNSGIPIIDGSLIIKVIRWQHEDKIELRVKEDLVQHYENNGKLERMRNECQRLNELIREYMNS